MSRWIGVDFDGTLAEHYGWNGGVLGQPVPTMLARVRRWVKEGKEVRIFTARVGTFEGMDEGSKAMIAEQRRLIEDWTERHVGKRLKVTAMKDFGMIELWDDRAVAVEMNTGRVLGGGRE